MQAFSFSLSFNSIKFLWLLGTETWFSKATRSVWSKFLIWIKENGNHLECKSVHRCLLFELQITSSHYAIFLEALHEESNGLAEVHKTLYFFSYMMQINVKITVFTAGNVWNRRRSPSQYFTPVITGNWSKCCYIAFVNTAFQISTVSAFRSLVMQHKQDRYPAILLW